MFLADTIIPNPISIMQVFGAAAAISYSRCGKNKLWENLAKGILNTSYLGLFHTAATNPSSNKLFLTFIGGGVFGNPIGWICDAILSAGKHYKNAGLEVYIVSYSTPCSQTVKLIDDLNRL
eukprot:sb/3476124/